jgi:ribosomal protein S18 acetylase RimI-like enzyme
LAIEVRDLRPGEMNAAVGLLSRGMRDNPLNVAAYGPNAARRQRALEGMFATLFRVFPTQRPLCALDGETLVAVGGVAPAGTCRATPGQRLRFLPGMVTVGLPSARRVSRWLAAWGERDPARAHSHLGPVAVEPALRGRGIGSELMREHTRQLDQTAQLGYLETDRRENVTFYERHGYVVVDQAEVIGVPNWFMSREPRTAGD